jgi:hypothetical protein
MLINEGKLEGGSVGDRERESLGTGKESMWVWGCVGMFKGSKRFKRA